MSMLKPARNRMAFAKVGLYGTAGSGKTYTAAKIAIGLHQYTKSTKPVGMFDTEPAASYIIPLFEQAGVPFLVYDESRALKDLMAFMDEAEKECSVVIIDSITHVWRDTQESYLAKINEGLRKRGKRDIYKLEFHHWGPIKAAWAEFTDRFLSSKLHAIVCGRAGSIYEYQTNEESGKKELITSGTRMATEKEMGYEPSLLIELAPVREDGKIVNMAFVQKDRTDTLNGQEIASPDFEKLKSHFAFLNIGGEHHGSMNTRDSKDLFSEDGSDSWSAEQRSRKIVSEEIEELLKKHYPAQSVEHKQKRQELLEEAFNTRSWTKISESTSSDILRNGLNTLRAALEPDVGDEDLKRLEQDMTLAKAA
ncbi:MAG: AAA family ATPase [bacterium]|jgi:hypothetical protein|nr:ATP-binding protein [Betaproteobacteria bacterium]